MVRPFRAYQELAAGPDAARGALTRPLLELFVIAAFVSFTTAGRLVAAQLFDTMVFWIFVPLLQAGSVLVAARAVGVAPSRRVLALYFAGIGPFSLWVLAVSAMCLFAPDVAATFTALLSTGVLPLSLFATMVWGGYVTWAFFAAGLGLPRRRAALGTVAFYLVAYGGIVACFLLTNAIQPQLFGVPA